MSDLMHEGGLSHPCQYAFENGLMHIDIIADDLDRHDSTNSHRSVDDTKPHAFVNQWTL